MKNIMIVLPQNIFPPTDGGKICMYYHVDVLCKNNNIYLAVNNNDKNYNINICNNVKNIIDIILLPIKTEKALKIKLMSNFMKIFKWIFYDKPHAEHRLTTHDNKNSLMSFIKKNKINIIFLETIYVAGLIDIEYCKINNIKIICIEHNIEYKFIKDCLSKFKLAATIESHRTKKYELDIITRVDKVIAISPQDAKELNKLIGKERVQYMPTPMPKKQMGWKNVNTNYIVFSGSLNFYPNYCAIKWLLENIWDKFHELHPNITLKITGNVSDKIKKKMERYENVVFTGFLDDYGLEKLTLNTLFEIIPINKGSGIKIKLLEALSLGIPIIATKHCYDGVPFNVADNNPYFVAKDANDFLYAMCEFVKNNDLREQYSLAGYDFYNDVYASEETRCNWQKLVDEI